MYIFYRMAGNVSIRDNVETCRIGMFVFIRWIKLNTHNKKEIQVFLPVSLLRSIHSYTKNLFHFCLSSAYCRRFFVLSDNFHFPADKLCANQIIYKYRNYLI